MKILQINEAIEQTLVLIFDRALKHEGMSILSHIDKVRNAIQVSQVLEEPVVVQSEQVS